MLVKPTLKTKLRSWYAHCFPDDELGKSIDEKATFSGLFDTLDGYQDVYAYIGVGDSFVRECIFEGLASCIDADYSYIYDQWLKGAKE